MIFCCWHSGGTNSLELWMISVTTLLQRQVYCNEYEESEYIKHIGSAFGKQVILEQLSKTIYHFWPIFGTSTFPYFIDSRCGHI